VLVMVTPSSPRAVISTSTLGPAAVAVVSLATGRPSTLICTPI
jgi:hypothetical protein